MELKDIASIQSGYYVSNKISGDVVCLQAKHFDDYGNLKSKDDLIKDVDINNIKKTSLLNNGDLLFASKGTRNYVALYKNEYGPCIASSTFFVIRLNTPKILPEYLKIVLNEMQKTSYFKNNLSGGYIQSISKYVIEKIDFDYPDIKKQYQIIKLYNLYLKELELYKNLKEKKAILINKVILSNN